MTRLFTIIGICLLAAGFSACTHKSAVLPNTANPSITTGNPATGDWTVILYTNRGVDETPDFDGYVFTFSANGVFTATRNTLSVNGNWTRTAANNLQELLLSISSATDGHLAELDETWVISLMNDNNINLVDDSGHYELRFQKAQ